ncbi:MAG: hypothetical protein QOD07_728 [Frankiaceae bacterium]|jgi:hypothetical protein|nr:hypothetical protein [Frankiaceae bacterium]
MTEQIEHELTAMFRDRAERLDVLPAPSRAQVRRGTLQAGLALASVLAVLAGVVLAGARLADGAGSGAVTSTTASGQRALADLSKALRKTLAARMVATTTTVGVPSKKNTKAPDLGFSAALGRGETHKTTYDGRAGLAVETGPDGQVETLAVGDVLYVHTDQRNDRFLPVTIGWVRYTKAQGTSTADWRRQEVQRAIPGLLQLYTEPPLSVDERNGRIRLSGPDLAGMQPVTVVQLDSSGMIRSVTSRWLLTMANAASDRLDRVTFRPLRGAMPSIEAPSPANVISSDDYGAEKANYEAQTNCPTPPPSTAPDGTVVHTQVDCLPPPPGATPAPTSTTPR